MWLKMEFAVKSAFSLCLLCLLDIIDAQKICKVPNGDAGTCVQIANCPPLRELYKKKHKTPQENSYFRQSFCGTAGILKVCCPPESQWSKFEAKPVLYPNLPTVTQSPTPITNKPPKPVTEPQPVQLSISPATVGFTDELNTRNFPDEDEVTKVCGKDTSSSNKIIGASEVAIDQYPWLALLEYAGENLACGGSLISHTFVLTAAHCLNGIYGPPFKVRLAEYNTSSFPTDSVEVDGGGFDNITVSIITVKATYPYPMFDRMQKIHDIGLVELLDAVKITSDFIKAICLPSRNFMPDFNALTNFTIAGWGSTGMGKASDVKLELKIPYVPWDHCEKVQGPDVIDSQICAGGEDKKDSCDGDSGGPLMYEYEDRYYIVGIISYGHRTCGTKGRPATHTYVYKYMSWIKDTMSGRNRN